MVTDADDEGDDEGSSANGEPDVSIIEGICRGSFLIIVINRILA